MEEVRRLRLKKGWNQNELAFHADLAPSVISLVETGKREPNATTLRKLADALGVDIPDLFRRPESPKVGAPSSPKVPEEEDAGEAALSAWVEHLGLTLERAKELQGEFGELAEYMRNTPREEREPVVTERRIAWVFSGCLEFSLAVSRAVKAYRKHLAPLLEGDRLPPEEEGLIRAVRSRLEEIRPIRRRFLDLIGETRRASKDLQHVEKMLRELGQELNAIESDAAPKDV